MCLLQMEVKAHKTVTGKVRRILDSAQVKTGKRKTNSSFSVSLYQNPATFLMDISTTDPLHFCQTFCQKL